MAIANVGNMVAVMNAEFEAAKAATERFEETIKDLPADKQSVLRALRQIAKEGRPLPLSYSRNSMPTDSSCGPGGFLLGFLLGEAL